MCAQAISLWAVAVSIRRKSQMNTLKAEKRDMSIKAKKLRREGFVTGNVFGREIQGSMPIKMAKADAERLLKTNGKGSQIMLEVDGRNMDVLVKEIVYNSMKRQIDEMDFQALVSGEKVHSVAEVVLLGHDKLQEGVLQELLHEISYKAVPAALVEKVEIDVSAMKVGDTIKVKDLPIASDKDVDLLTDPETVVLTVTKVHYSAAEDESGEETEDAAK
jgi:large subunit ribosomal protein L25